MADNRESSGRSFRERVYALARRVPAGRVITYGDIALALGSPRAARVVGGALHTLPDGSDVPWHRVVNVAGRISPRPGIGPRLQADLLREEGITFDDAGAVDLRTYGWWPGDE